MIYERLFLILHILKISVITVCRNNASTIGDCLRSVASQTHRNVEHLVIDGASADDTMEIVEAMSRQQLLAVSEPDEGIYDAMNKGISRATGEVIGFLNADDFYASDDVLAEVATILEDPDLDGCYADLEYVDGADTERVVRYWRSEPFRPGLFRKGWLPPHPTFFARREIYEKHGGFDTSFTLGADWDLLLRFFEVAKIRTHYTPLTWIKMRSGGATNRSLSNILRNNRECWRAFKKYGMRPSLFYPVTKLAHRLKQFGAARRLNRYRNSLLENTGKKS